MSDQLTPFQKWWVQQKFRSTYKESIVGACEAAFNAGQAAGDQLECIRCHEVTRCVPLDTKAHVSLCPKCISLMFGEAHQLMDKAARQLNIFRHA